MVDMAQFLPAQIDLLERQVESYASHVSEHAAAMLCYDVEEVMSLYNSLFHEIERAAEKTSPSEIGNPKNIQEFVPLYSRHVRIGERIRELIRPLKSLGFEVSGLDPFMRALIAARAGAASVETAGAISAYDRGEIKTRPLQGR